MNELNLKIKGIKHFKDTKFAGKNGLRRKSVNASVIEFHSTKDQKRFVKHLYKNYNKTVIYRYWDEFVKVDSEIVCLNDNENVFTFLNGDIATLTIKE